MEKIGKKLKHDHTLTSILKFAIFSMVMLAPIFSIASRCLYVICNKNAKDTQQQTYLETIQRVNQDSDFIDNDTYYVNNWHIQDDNNVYVRQHIEFYFYTTTLDISSMQNYNPSYTYVGLNATIYDDSGSCYYRLYYYDELNVFGTTALAYRQLPVDNWTFVARRIENKSFSINEGTYCYRYFYKYSYNYDYMNDAFEYSLSQLEESSYYNWATNLGIYEPINNMVSGLGGHSIISLLLAYWSIYTAIYIVFDIIIACFVKLTHFVSAE